MGPGPYFHTSRGAPPSRVSPTSRHPWQTIMRYLDDDDDEVATAAFNALSQADPSGKLLQNSPIRKSLTTSEGGSPSLRQMPSSSTSLVSPARKQGSMAQMMAASSSALKISDSKERITSRRLLS